MRQQLLYDDGGKTWAVVLDTGDEVSACLLDFATANRLDAAHLSAIGAFERAVLGYFAWPRRTYRHNPVDTQCEVVSLLGDITLSEGKPMLHMHAVLGLADGRALGGHLLEGHVRPTLEVVVTEAPAQLRRRHDPVSGLALIDLQASTARKPP
jgi:predicted DNA-binding protein with PD1-like motif